MTNKQNLPQAFLNYVNGEKKPYVENRYSVTELLNPIRCIKLTRMHADEIEEDLADCIPALFGTAVHSILEKNAPADVLTEIKMEIPYGKYTIVGKYDVYDEKNSTIEDYKTCSTYKIQTADFGEWRRQGLMYAWMVYMDLGKKVERIRFHALLKDWSKIKAASTPSYPQSPVYTYSIDVNDSNLVETQEWLDGRLAQIGTDGIPECTPEDRWNKGDTYAVYKNETDKRAAYLASSQEDADSYIANRLAGKGTVIVRKGEDTRCAYYCPLKNICRKEKGGN